MQLLQPDEDGNELFRRMDRQAFSLKLPNSTEELHFQESVEVITPASDVADFVLTTAIEFAAQVEGGLLLHVSLGNNLFHSLSLSGVDTHSTPLYLMHSQGRAKSITVHSLRQLLAVAEFVRTAVQREKVLVLLEGLSSLFALQKTTQGRLPPSALVHSVLSAFQRLSKLRSVTSLWVNSSAVKGGGGLREGNFRDPVSTLWKQKVPKTLHYWSSKR